MCWAGRRCRVASRSGAALAALLLLLPAGCANPRLSELETTLAAQDSATAALGQWCERQKIASPPLIRAAKIADPAPRPLPAEGLRLLAPQAGERLASRHVRLTCGGVVLSEAWNWYLPARLPDEANVRLETTDTPFGKVLSGWGFERRRLASRRGRAAGCPAGTVLSHSALLDSRAGVPVSFVIECYTRAALAPPLAVTPAG